MGAGAGSSGSMGVRTQVSSEDKSSWNSGVGTLEWGWGGHPKRRLLIISSHLTLQGSTKSLNHSKQRSTLPR